MHVTLVYTVLNLVVKPCGDLMCGLHVSTAPGVALSLEGELCSHDVPADLKV